MKERGDAWLWRTDSASLNWEPLEIPGEGPAARFRATLTALSCGTAAVLVGGRDGVKAFADVWVLDSRPSYRWTRLDVPGASPRFGHDAVLQPTAGGVADRVLIFGGCAGLEVPAIALGSVRITVRRR